jgi:hypothetical protein
MANRKDVVAEQLRQLADDLEELWRAVTRDPAAEKRKERAWTLVIGLAGAASSIASRKLVTKLWVTLTGEQPPLPGAPPSPKRPAPVEREEVPAPPADAART